MWLITALSILACYRLSLMLSSEEGPARLFARVRRTVPAKSNPGRGIRCFFCWTVWTAPAITAYLYAIHLIRPEITPIYWLGITGGAVFIHQLAKPS